MDSWSRPNKHATTPPPLYLTVGDAVPYCHSCGRVISDRRKTAGNTEVKYCSARCRNSKPGPVDRKIEATFATLLDGATIEQVKAQIAGDSGKNDADKDHAEEKEAKKHKKKNSKSMKGDHRPIIECQVVEEIVFQREKDPEKVYGRRKNRRARFVVEKPEDWKSVDMVDDPAPPNSNGQAESLSSSESFSDADDPDDEGGVVLENAKRGEVDGKELPDAVEYGYGGGKVRPPQAQNDVNGSVGGEKGWAERIEETDDMKAKRREGQRRADEREMVRKAARRGCAFGFLVDVEPEEEDVKGKKGGKGKASKEVEPKSGQERKKCEAVMKGVVVESSFAKGEWGIRWREKI